MKKLMIFFTIIGISMLGFYSINKATSVSGPLENLKNPIATIILENSQVFKIELYPKYAPNTVNNFIDLVNKKFYNNKPFSKIIPNYLLQTGDPIGDGTGFPGYFIKSECKQNGFKNRLKCEQGTVCMARSKKYNTEGSQFFILLQDDSSLYGHYTAFGKVIEGINIAQEVGMTQVKSDNTPLEEIKIKTITVDTFGITYDEPQVISIYEERSK